MNIYSRNLLTGAALAATLALAPAALAEEITVSHAQGETTLQTNPETVYVFDYAALDLLDTLGIEVDGVPATNMPPYLSKYAGDEYAKIGSIFEPDYEAVNAGQPDLTIVAARSSTAYPQLSEMVPTIDVTNDWGDFIGSSKANAELIGTIFEKQDEVAALIDDLDASIAEFNEAAPDLGTVFVVLTSAGEVTAYGPGSRFGFVHDALGLEPAVEDVEEATHGEAISFEFILETNPDWLIVLDRDAAVGQGTGAAEQVLDNELVHQTNAWQNDQVIYVDPVRWYITNGGVSNLNAIIDELSAAMLDG